MTELTVLTEMMDPDLERAVDALSALGIYWLDLKGGVFGKAIEELNEADAERLARLLERTGAAVWCFSSVLGHWCVDASDKEAFQKRLLSGCRRLARLAKIVRPRFVRLLACSFSARLNTGNSIAWLADSTPWVFTAYRDAVELLAREGLDATIENEPGSVLASVEEVQGFFDRIACSELVSFTWDIQNMWKSGTFPTLDVYNSLRSLIRYVHLKGGRALGDDPHVMTHRSTLDRADWPVEAIVSAVITDGVSPVLCLNCSHGPMADDDELAYLWGSPQLVAEEARRDIAYLRRTFTEVA